MVWLIHPPQLPVWSWKMRPRISFSSTNMPRRPANASCQMGKDHVRPVSAMSSRMAKVQKPRLTWQSYRKCCVPLPHSTLRRCSNVCFLRGHQMTRPVSRSNAKSRMLMPTMVLPNVRSPFVCGASKSQRWSFSVVSKKGSFFCLSPFGAFSAFSAFTGPVSVVFPPHPVLQF